MIDSLPPVMDLRAGVLVVDAADGGHRVLRRAAAGRPRRSSLRPAAGRFAPGIAHVTASNIRIQRSANCGRLIPGGQIAFNSSTARKPVS